MSDEQKNKKGWFGRLRDKLAGEERPEEAPDAGVAATPEPTERSPGASRAPEGIAPPPVEPAPLPGAPVPDEVHVVEERTPEPRPEPEPKPAPQPEPAPRLDLPPVTAAPGAAQPAMTRSWFHRLREGLSRSSDKLTEGITGIFTKRRLDDEAIEQLEELLITADLGPTTAAKVAAELARNRFGKEVSPEEVRRALADQVTRILEPVARRLEIDPARKPHVILVVGVNGTGKTTTIGKLSKAMREEGKRVMLAAGDTFRAAAVSQLKIWGERADCPVVAKEHGADAAALAYEALERARRDGMDVLMIDTAGRLQNKAGLMAELQKIVRVLKKLDPDAPHTTLLTLDATTGQNAHSQVQIFQEMVQVNGIVLTKLDGSAKGGVLVGLADRFDVPVHAIGIGEGPDDLRPFQADAFARSLMGLPNG